MIKGDFEYQHKTERDGSGYQLLGGTMLPDINRIYRSTMLGDQPWGPPDTYDTYNASARLDRTFSPSWVAFASASLSHSLIQDNVIYAYGCYYEAECNTGSAPYPLFFAPDGTYDVYDYRDPGELRIDAEVEAMLTGHIHTGPVTQDVTAGGVLFLRSVQQPGFYTATDPTRPMALCRTALSTPMSARQTSISRSRRYPRPATRIPLSIRSNPPAHDASGKTATNPPASFRTAFIFPRASS